MKTWREKKLHTNIVIYTKNQKCVSYIFQQIIQLIFKQISLWTKTNKNTLTINLLFEKIKQYIGIYILVFFIQKKLSIIVIKNNKSVNAYYYQIFSF